MAEAKKKPNRLGRGLAALIGEVDGQTPAKPDKQKKETKKGDAATAVAPKVDTANRPTANEIDISLIRPNPAQPRRDFDEETLVELANSLKQKGMLQAILVRPDPKRSGGFQIVAGERRWRAAKKAGLMTVPAVVRELDELELLEIGIIENVQRSDLNPIEEAEAYGSLMKRFGRTQESLAESVGKSRAHIANTLRLLNLPEIVRDAVREGRLSAGHARAMLAAPDPEAIARETLERGLSVRDVEAMVRRLKDGVVDDRSARPSSNGGNKDVDTLALESDVSRAIGLDVDIRHGEKGGEIRIKYRELEQLDEICRKLSARR